MLRLRNRLFPLLRLGATTPLLSPIHCRAYRLLSTSTSASTSASTSTAILPASFSLEDYLVVSCGLAPAQAREVSKKASHEVLYHGSRRPLEELSYSRLYSASNPDAILALLSGAGLSRADITAVVSADPLLLRASVKNIDARLVALHDRVGLSTTQIARFILVDSRALRCCDVVPRLEFFISFYGSFDRVLVATKRNRGLLLASLERVIKPNIALFCQWGVRDFAKLCANNPWVLTFNPERLKEVLLRAEELGVPTTSPMFRQAVDAIASISKEKVAAKLEFLKRTLGCSESEVSTAVSKKPTILRFSDEILLLLVGSRALRDCDVIPRLEFFISFYGSFEQVLVVVKRCMTLLTASPERLIKPNIALLRQWGVRDIAQLCTDNAWVLTFKPERMKEFLLRAEELGVPPTSRMFRHAVATVSRNSKDRVAAKLEFYKRILGVSESEVSTAVSKMPNILGFSDEILLRKIKFLVNEAAMDPRYIVERPVLFALSLEKRLVPRHYVMKVLQEKGPLDSNMSFYSVVALGEDTFKSKFIDRHKDSVPGLADTYAAARGGIVPSRI